jgi:hypothetical protein
MRWLIVLPALALTTLALATPALTCPPPPPAPPGTPVPTQGDMLRAQAAAAPNIVYGVVERSIGLPLAGEEQGWITIAHVYKGSLRSGQRIPMYFETRSNDCDWGPIEPARRGEAGVIFLPDEAGRAPIRYPGFRASEEVDAMIRLGIITSARAD